MDKKTSMRAFSLASFSRRLTRRENILLAFIAAILVCTVFLCRLLDYEANADLEAKLKALDQRSDDVVFSPMSDRISSKEPLVEPYMHSSVGVVEVLGHSYSPKAKTIPSLLPAATQNSIPWFSSESLRQVSGNDKNVINQTVEPVPDSVLILTPVKNNAKHLARYFSLLDKLDYPRDRISIAFLVSDSIDATQNMLLESQRWYQEQGPKEMRFRRFDIYRQDFFYSLPRGQRHLRHKQKERRTVMARARNYLWTRALENEQWVLWMDGDLEHYPTTILRDLMAYDKDIIVPNCLLRKRKASNRWKHIVYDRNAWQETKKSRETIAKLDKDVFLLEGYKSLITHRRYLDDFSENDTIVPLDGVGGTFTLVKADVHRSGVVFPTWLFEHQVETEGFAKLAKANGFGVYGLPYYYIRHIVS